VEVLKLCFGNVTLIFKTFTGSMAHSRRFFGERNDHLHQIRSDDVVFVALKPQKSFGIVMFSKDSRSASEKM